MYVNKRRFGNSELGVTPIGLGTWPLGGARYGQSDDVSARRTIAAALDAAITCFDTAPSYGNGHAEELLGQALKGKRDDVVLVTKGGLVWNDRSEVLGHDGNATHLKAVLDDSLRRLQTDYVDLFLIHWPDKTMQAEQTAEALTRLIDAGKTRYVGVSNYMGEEFRKLSEALGDIPLVVNQVSYHLFDQRWALSSFKACQDLGAGIMAYGSLAHGLLSGTFNSNTVFDDTDWRASGVIFGQPLLTPENRKQNLMVVDKLSTLAGETGMSLPRLALAWVLGNPAVTTSLVGARNPLEIEEAASAGEVRLDDALRKQIDEVMSNAAGLVSQLTD